MPIHFFTIPLKYLLTSRSGNPIVPSPLRQFRTKQTTMIEYLLGVDGGGTGTRVRLARADGAELAQASGGPSGLGLGIAKAWAAISDTVAQAFAAAGIAHPALGSAAIGLGLAGVH